MFQNILATTEDFQKQDVVVLNAARLSAKNSARFHVLHVLASLRPGTPPVRTEESLPKDNTTVDTMDDMRALEGELRHTYRNLAPDPDHFTVKVTRGIPSYEITRYAERIDASLIVMGPPSAYVLEQQGSRLADNIESDFQKVIMQAKAPVMITKNLIPESALNFKNIIVGIDFSVSCKKALTYAAGLANAFDSKVLPFHMLPVPPIPEYSQADYEVALASAQKDLFSFCAPILAGTAHELSIWGGAHPHLEILKLAEQNDADLIVLGSHTKEDQGKWYPGSVVKKVGTRSVCPAVVITHSVGRKFQEDALRQKKPA